MVSSQGRTYSLGAAFWRAGLVLMALASLVILFAPASDVPSNIPISDKVIHAGLFTGLALTALMSLAHRRAVVATLLGYALVSEILQALLPINRDFGWGDVAADVFGVLIGLLLQRS